MGSPNGRKSESTGNFANLHFDVLLSVSCATLAVLASTEFLDEKLFAFGFADDFGGNGCAFDGRFSQFESVIGRNGQDTFKGEIVASGQFAEINFQHLAFFDFILASAVSNNRVHL